MRQRYVAVDSLKRVRPLLVLLPRLQSQEMVDSPLSFRSTFPAPPTLTALPSLDFVILFRFAPVHLRLEVSMIC